MMMMKFIYASDYTVEGSYVPLPEMS